MNMTAGQLYDLFMGIRSAEQEIAAAHRALRDLPPESPNRAEQEKLLEAAVRKFVSRRQQVKIITE